MHSKELTFETLMSFRIWRVSFWIMDGVPGMTMVILDKPSVSLVPTARLWMLYPRLAITPVTCRMTMHI